MSRMSRAAYQQLEVLLRHVVVDNPADEQVRRLAKGLAKALAKWLRMTEPLSAQARNGAPRANPRLAVVNASLSGETEHGTQARTERADRHRVEHHPGRLAE